LEYVRENEIEIAFDYQRKFINKQNFLNISITNSSNFDKENTDITTQSLDALLNNINNTLIQKTHNYEDGSITTTKIDYGFPLITNTHFEMGYKAIYRLVNTDFLNATKMGNDYIPNPISTNNFNFKEQIQAGYLNLNSYFGEKENPVFSYEIGGRTEYIKNNGENKSVSKTFTNEYIKFFPNIRFLHYFNVNSYIKLSYEKRINRPNFGQLNPFVDITDSLNPHSGNPNLKPEIIDNFELSFNKDWDKINFITNIYFRYATDAIRAYIFLQNNGVALIMPINIGNSTTIGLEQILRHKVNSTFDYTISNALYNQTIDATNQTNGQTQHAIAWNIKSINNIQISQKGKLQVVGSYSSATPSTQGSRNAQYYIDLGYQLKIGKTGNSRLGLTIIDLFNTLETGYQNNTALFTNFRNVKTDTRALMITFAHTFKTI
ncbi:MAG: outer membrane beta-barrel family protein, partial [Sediminibacterium sp.]|nr:outer membrane beta-barrel family protein [Sediminibacterium sp.]